MKRINLFVSLLFLLALNFPLRSPAASVESGPDGDRRIVGFWQGSLKPASAIEFRLVLELTNSTSQKIEGAIISVDQGNTRIPITALTQKAGAIHLETGSIGGAFDGRLNNAGSEIAGDWKQGGQSMPLVFRKLAKAPVFRRPQDPRKPFPYHEEEVVVESANGKVHLAGTLTVPEAAGPHAAVVLIPGTGPEDRDEAIMGHRPFLVLADHLTRKGIAVLRCDKRGVGKSTGDFAKATDADFVEDTLASVAYLRGRKEIDPKRIGLIGHSEGGIVASIAAEESDNVSFLVLLASMGLPVEEVLVRQGQDVSRSMGLSEQFISHNTDMNRRVFRILKEDKDTGAAEAALRKLSRESMMSLPEDQRKVASALFEGQMETMLTPWFRDLLSCDPRTTLRAVKCPVLAIGGDKDLQVAAKENLAAIRQALESGGNDHVKTAELPGLNHLLQTCQTGAITEYGQIEETMAPMALSLISDWIRQQTSR